MKKYVAAVVAVVFLALSLMCVPVYANDNAIEKAGDWWAVRGKNEPEKSIILSGRRTERAAKKAEKEMRKATKRMEKDMNKALRK